MQEQNRKKTDNVLGLLTLVCFTQIAVIIILAVAVFMCTKNTEKSTQEPEESGNTASAKHKLVENLTEVASDINSKENQEYIATVVTFNDLEYLCLSDGKISIYYQNEFYNTDNSTLMNEDAAHVIISNGTRTVSYPWNYDLSADAGFLLPVDANLGTARTDAELMFFGFSGENKVIPDSIWLVNRNTLNDCEQFDLAGAIRDCFKSDYMKLYMDSDGNISLNESGNGTDVLSVVFGKGTYNYHISDSALNDSESEKIGFDRNFEISVSESDNSGDTDVGKIDVSCVVSDADEKYLGMFAAEIEKNGQTLELTDVSFASYADPTQEDEGSNGIITPLDSPIEDGSYITLYGKDNTNYILAVSDNIAKNTVDASKFVTDASGFMTYNDGNKTSKIGIDVSKFQGTVDWAQVKKAGVEFAIIRLGFRGYSEGNLYVDPYFEQNIKSAEENGIEVGVYFFSQAVNRTEALEEAKLCIDNIKEYRLDYPVYFDTEPITADDGRANHLTREERTDITKAFCKAVTKAGFKAGFYANTKWSVMGVNMEKLSDYDFWFAFYGDSFTYPYRYDMLQYSESGTVPGITGECDLDIDFN